MKTNSTAVNRELEAIGNKQTVKATTNENRYVWLVIAVASLLAMVLSMAGLTN